MSNPALSLVHPPHNYVPVGWAAYRYFFRIKLLRRYLVVTELFHIINQYQFGLVIYTRLLSFRDSLNVGTVPTFNLHLVGTLKNLLSNWSININPSSVCTPCTNSTILAIKTVSFWSGYSFVGLIKTDQLVTINIMHVMS